MLEHVKRSVGNPPSTPCFSDQEPPLDAAADLVPTKRRRRDPRPGVVSKPETKPISDSFLAGETGIRVDKGKNVWPDDETIDIVKLQSRTGNELKDKRIKDLETNIGHLSAIVLDLKQMLQDKFNGEFIDESSTSTAAEPAPELRKS
ncbi:hypothetical protein R6Q57_018628 [Mikania cordata]